MPLRPQPQARRGSRFHAWVEQLYGAVPLLEPDDLPGAGDDSLSRRRAHRFAAALPGRRLGRAAAGCRGAPFELVVGGRLVRGRIDAIYPRDGGGYDVIDYKTGQVPRDFAAAVVAAVGLPAGLGRPAPASTPRSSTRVSSTCAPAR